MLTPLKKRNFYPYNKTNLSQSRLLNRFKTRSRWQWVILILVLILLGQTEASAQNDLVTFKDVSSQAGLSSSISIYGVAWADYDGDGWEDIMVGHYYERPSLYRNNGDGTFTDRADQAGLPPERSDSKPSTWGDYDNDGDPDLYTINGRGEGGGFFHINNGDGTFTNNQGDDYTYQAYVAKIENNWGRGRIPRWVDFDNDGNLDIYLGNGRSDQFNTLSNRLYRNRGNGTFSSVSESAGVDVSAETKNVLWGDYNNDGYADLLVSPNLLLYKNQGNGQFKEVTSQTGLRSYGGVSDMAWGDYDNDGDLDLYLGRSRTDFGDYASIENGNTIHFTGTVSGDEDGIIFENSGSYLKFSLWHRLYEIPTSNIYIGSAGRNPSSHEFKLYENDSDNVGKPSGYSPGRDNGVFIWKDASSGKWHVHRSDKNRDTIVFEITSDGTVSNLSDVDIEWFSGGRSPNYLYRNNGNGTFTDVTSATKMDSGGRRNTNGVAWIDFDNDGDLDLYEVNGGDVETGNEDNRMMLNNGNGTFTDVAQEVGLKRLPYGHGKCSSWSDFNKDGFMDLFLSGNRFTGYLSAAEKLYRNQGNDNSWLEIKLVGTESNRDGIGAKVKIKTAAGIQYRDTNLTSSGACQSSSIVHFGLGNQSEIEELTITWPSGIVDTIQNPPFNQRLTLVEGEAQPPVHTIILDPTQQRKDGLPNEQISFTHNVTNNGPTADTINLSFISAPSGWNGTVSPTSLALGPNETGSFTVTVNVPANAVGGSRENFRIQAQLQNKPEVTSETIDKVDVTLIAGVSISPQEQSKTGLPDDTIIFEHTITNMGNGPDTVNLSAQSNWNVNLTPNKIDNLGPGETASLTVQVQIPPDAIGNDQDVVTIKAISQNDPDIKDSATDTVSVEVLYGVQLTPDQQQKSGSSGKPLIFNHKVKNIGTVPDSFDMTATPDLSQWIATVSPSQFELQPNETVSVEVKVWIPQDASFNTQATIDLLVQSQTNSALRASGTDTITVEPYYEVLLIPEKENFFGFPGETLTLSHIIKNQGNANDSYNITVTSLSASWPMTLSTEIAHLAPNESTPLELMVTIPEDALADSQETFQITVQSQADSTVKDVNQDVITVQQDQGVRLISEDNIKFGLPGEPVVLNYTLENTGNATDNFDLSAESLHLNWETLLMPAQVENLAPSEKRTVQLLAWIPLDAPLGDRDIFMMTVQSQSDADVKDNHQDIITVESSQGVLLSPQKQVHSDSPGEAIIFEHQIKNTGHHTDSFHITALPLSADWPVDVSPAQIDDLAVGEMVPVDVTVWIPQETSIGSEAIFKIMAQSQTDLSVKDVSADIAVAQTDQEILIAPEKEVRLGIPGEWLLFKHAVTNKSQRTDSFDLTLDSLALDWTATISPTHLNDLAPDETAIVEVNLWVPWNRSIHHQEDFKLIVQSQTDSTIKTFAQDTVLVKPARKFALSPIPPRFIQGPGTQLQFTQRLTNTGNLSDSFEITTHNTKTIETGSSEWPVTVTPSLIENLAPGESVPFTITVDIPAEAQQNESQNIILTIISHSDSSLQEEMSYQIEVMVEDADSGYTYFLPFLLRSEYPSAIKE